MVRKGKERASAPESLLAQDADKMEAACKTLKGGIRNYTDSCEKFSGVKDARIETAQQTLQDGWKRNFEALLISAIKEYGSSNHTKDQLRAVV